MIMVVVKDDDEDDVDDTPGVPHQHGRLEPHLLAKILDNLFIVARPSCQAGPHQEWVSLPGKLVIHSPDVKEYDDDIDKMMMISTG